ncbi:hypothetical protein IX38_05445 [Chryseobacterium luteum]|uniref:Uncharacterized protein n=2 Tax=Chryseobacterium luteum TaxID=421531 RepID=A0A085ZWQ4_9FLAO|nr:hypothetical protein IX38_05445 [Chryseobacterium luteum]
MYREPVNYRHLENHKLPDTIFSKSLPEVMPYSTYTKLAPSVRVFFAAKRRKMYREPVNYKHHENQKLRDTIFSKSLFKVTNIQFKLKATKDYKDFETVKNRMKA